MNKWSECHNLASFVVSVAVHLRKTLMIENIIFPAFWDKLPLAQPVHVWEVVVPVGATNITFYCKKVLMWHLGACQMEIC